MEKKNKEDATTSAGTKKSTVKASGVKSTFALGEETVITSFGKGNAAVIEKVIKDNKVVDVNNKPVFEIDEEKLDPECKKIPIIGRYKNPNAKSEEDKYPKAERPVPTGEDKVLGMDYLRLKPKLMEKYSGKTNDNDNIHIQLIYNILDIKKILAPHSSNIVFSLNNLQGIEVSENDDFIGSLSANPEYEGCNDFSKLSGRNKKIFNKYKKNSRLGYFGSVFYVTNGNGKDEQQLRPDEDIFNILALMASLRHSCVHGDDTNSDWLFNLDSKLKETYKNTLDKLYDPVITSLNNGFTETNKVNLNIVYPLIKKWDKNASPTSAAADYYDFVVPKKYKYMGFSLKKLKECMLELKTANTLKDKKYDTMRKKVNNILYFIMYYNYIHLEPEKSKSNVEELRSAVSRADKEAFYIREAKRLWDKFGSDIMELITSKINANSIKKLGEKKDIYGVSIKDIDISAHYIKADSAPYFCKLMYLACMFLDGKEINDLLTTLVNKFDNIASFIDVMDNLGLDGTFAQNFAMFEDSKNISVTLQHILSFARMQKPAACAKKAMYRDALTILGMDEGDIKQQIEDMIPKEGHSFRNFIIKNVIESSRFKYLIRYNNPQKSRAIAQNETVVKFALNQIPETQIDRYYESCHFLGAVDKDDKISELTKLITDLKFADFDGSDPNGRDKSARQTVISLYLTVLYLITKNLVYVNSRYIIAFHSLERDMVLNDIKGEDDNVPNCIERKDDKKPNKKVLNEETCLKLTKKYMENEDFITNKRATKGMQKKYPDSQGSDKKVYKRSYYYINNSLENAEGSEKLFMKYRNNIAHLSVIRNANKYIGDIGKFDTYFELYHYITQRLLKNRAKKESIKVSSKFQEYFDCVDKYNTYCKDMVKALNVAFAYNLPRYINLSVNEKFDKNYKGTMENSTN